MQRSDYGFQPLTYEQFEQIVTASEMAGNTSPMHGRQNYDSFIAAAKAGDIDPRVVLSATLWEDHDGTDPAGGVELAKVQNYAGIKWAGQPGAFDSGIPYPLAEGVGNYAGFHDLGGFVAELIRTLNNQYCGPAFTSGDLARAWGIYIGGPNNPNMAGGQNRVDQWQYYRGKYPPEGETPVVTAADVLKTALMWEGCTDRGLYDPSNGHGTPFMWCQAFIESMAEHAGVTRVRYASALAFLNDPAIETHPMPAPAGTCVLYGRNFDPSGHVAISLGDGRIIGTTVDGIKVTPAFAGAAGWQLYPGVTLAAAPPAPIPDTFFIDDNPHGRVPIPLWAWSRWDALNTMGVPLSHSGEVNLNGLAMVTLGYATAPEVVLATGRRIQRYERGVLATGMGSAPWDVVNLLIEEI